MTGKNNGAKRGNRLNELTGKLKSGLPDRLVSVILYGSAAGGDWNENTSDLNVLCVLDRITPSELAKSEPVFRWWRDGGSPPPLLLTAEEVGTSTDCFPMEFHDMKERRQVLHGADLIAGLEIDYKFYRAQVEHELRAKQIRLRQRTAELLSAPERLQTLMVHSLSTFCVLGRHALILSGRPAYWSKREILDALAVATGHAFTGGDEILAIRTAGKQILPLNRAIWLLEQYLADVEALVRFVDRLDQTEAG